MKRFLFIPFIFLSLPVAVLAGEEKSRLIIFHAGSLSVPFGELEKVFEAKNPGIDVLRESSGSKLAARKVSELKKKADIVAVSDYSVIPKILYPAHASWTIYFARNRMVIVYTLQSKFSDEINKENWYKILLRKGVEYGHSDPLLDPCGYRTLLLWKLAEQYYKEPQLYKKLADNMPAKNIRPKETDLIALAEAGVLDYHFNYKSVAAQHHLKYLELPDEIDLSSYEKRDFYKTVSVELTDKDGKKTTETGEPVLYGITIIKNAPNPKAAEGFVRLLLSEDGQKILRKNFLEPIVPAQADNKEALPETLGKLIK